MRIGICDDMKSERERAETALREGKVLNLGEDTIALYSPEDVLSDLDEQIFQCDIMIMDIEFEKDEWNGITLTKKINGVVPSCQIIYLTNILEFAPEIYETEHCYFVLKKNMDMMLPQAVLKAKKLFEKLLKQSAVKIVSEGHTMYIMQKDIIYVERQERKIVIHTKQSSYISYMSLSAFLKCVDDELVRCHGGYIVNLCHITYLAGDYVMVDEKVKIPVGVTYCNKLKQRYLMYWSQRV